MTKNEPSVLEMHHVSRLRGGRRVIEDVSLHLARGQVLGLLGVNGAGKSTMLSMIAGATLPTAGEIRVEGLDLAEHPRAVRRRVGWLPERAPLYAELTVTEQIDAAARLRGLSRTQRRGARERLLERLQLGDLRRRLCERLSQGQRQRVGLACALVHDPLLVALDEPANGLDPVQMANWRALFAELACEHAVIVSSHGLTEIVATCNRVAILHEGRLRYQADLNHDDLGALERRFFDIVTRTEPATA